MSQFAAVDGGQLDPPDSRIPQLLSPNHDGAGQLANNKKEYITSGFESGTSRPPTPHGPGLPANFAEVVSGIYRSSFPLPDHFESIKKLNLKTIVTLVENEHSRQFKKFIKDNGITSYVIPIIANKDPKVFTSQNTVLEVLRILFNLDNHPVLVHCNKGKHRTGCIIACFRRAQGWSNTAAVAEYIKYSAPKTRVLDRKFIEAFDANRLCELVDRVGAQYWVASNLSERKDLRSTPGCHLNGNPKEVGECDGASALVLPSDPQQIYGLATCKLPS
ncbi:Putative tyrosine phosphatase family protein [Coccidioides posadasii C735 delta SOWgp]|uniref:diphosphoinositol-polyphosphate diphosphatase n=3 Tax=Coccidioides posadasii TaxID=199306 RepID=E9D0V4_COCPS|nr:Putative tyrosine phosphatase family protein [Coccidioides posadasii C735 delta SOWgp]EER26108.1 Putative tyrosine phosphatase family protein [Coccidioides posadasii C735 delta SOWgp]EFW19958.1 tyrosine-protein phosphatase SIW14 [Coccidioides posadasii str. Silveira]KMM73471.1 tyrosine-protein phosphatase SIW14 [Coccidioides posadasii RMSCC 3488]|eukprot:XP_003068253.1 Putative tyrosine phosphatase family protein [Coccidioides posadasii C735 delta SOWgp]